MDKVNFAVTWRFCTSAKQKGCIGWEGAGGEAGGGGKRNPYLNFKIQL